MLFSQDEDDFIEVKPKIAKTEKRKYTRRAKKEVDQVNNSLKPRSFFLFKLMTSFLRMILFARNHKLDKYIHF